MRVRPGQETLVLHLGQCAKSRALFRSLLSLLPDLTQLTWVGILRITIARSTHRQRSCRVSPPRDGAIDETFDANQRPHSSLVQATSFSWMQRYFVRGGICFAGRRLRTSWRAMCEECRYGKPKK